VLSYVAIGGSAPGERAQQNQHDDDDQNDQKNAH
jgi:hypothetical protein